MEDKKYHYVEIRQKADDVTVKRMAVSGGEKGREIVEFGINRQLNHDSYYTESVTSDTELDQI